MWFHFRQLWSLSARLFVEISENGLRLHHLQEKANLFDREDFSPGWILRSVAVVRVKTFENIKQLWDIERPFFCLHQDFLYMKLIVFHCWATCHKPSSDICKRKRAMAQYKSKLVAFLNENDVIPFLGNFGASLLDCLLRYLKMDCGYIICRERKIFLIQKSFLRVKY